jgi:hypothetical protein
MKNGLLLLALLVCQLLPAQEVEAIRQLEVSTSPEQVLRKRQNGLVGYQGSNTGKWYVPAEYEQLSDPYSDQIIAKKEGRFGLLNRQRQVQVPFEYERLVLPPSAVEYGTSGYRKPATRRFEWLLAKKQAGWGAVDYLGKTVRSFDFEEAFWINDSLVLWTRANRFRLEGPEEQVIWEESVEGWSWVNEEAFPRPLLWRIRQNGKTGILNHRGKWIVPGAEHQVRWCYGGMLCLAEGVLQTIYSYEGELLFPPQLATTHYLGADLALVVRDNKLGQSGVLHKSGRLVLPYEYAECHLVREQDGFLSSQLLITRRLKEPAYSLHNLEGKQLTPALYKEDVAWHADFYLVLAPLAAGGWHLLDAQGQRISDTVYNNLAFSGRVVIAELDEKKALFNAKGEAITEFKYHSIRGFTNPNVPADWERRFQLPYDQHFVAEGWYGDSGPVYITEEGKEYFFKTLKQ